MFFHNFSVEFRAIRPNLCGNYMRFHKISNQEIRLISLPHFHTHTSKSQEGHVKYVNWAAVFVENSSEENLS